MHHPLKIGFLTPYSGVYPHYAQHLTAGFLLGLNKDPALQKDIQFVPVYTGMGSTRQTMDALQKLLFFDRVDIVSGLISYMVVPEMIPLLEKEKKLGLFFDMGEYVPFFPQLSPFVFYVSHQLWQSEYALGYWAEKQFGGKGLLAAPVYEAGYHLQSAFHRGTVAAGSAELELYVFPYHEQQPSYIDWPAFFYKVRELRPSYVHGMFSGKLGNEFLVQWIQSGLHRQIPLLVMENMVYEDMLDDLLHTSLELYAPILWNRSSEDQVNRGFVRQFEAMAGQKANVYSLLGYEGGLAIRELLFLLQQGNWQAVQQNLMKTVVQGPRGQRNFYPASGFALPETDIQKIQVSGGRVTRTVVGQGKGLLFHDQVFEQIHRETASGWQNPFMCI